MERVQDANENILEVFENDIDLYLHQFQDEQGIEDFKQVGQSVWNGALRYIYKHVFKNNNYLLRDNTNYNINNGVASSNCNMYNYDLILDILDYYIYNMCMVNNKEVSILGFTTLTGIDESIIYDWGNNINKLSSTPSKIYKKLSQMREESLSNKLVDGNKNPVGIIACLNRHYGWSSPYTSDSNRNKQSLTAAELPKLTAQNSGICSPDVDKMQRIDCSNSGNSSQS